MMTCCWETLQTFSQRDKQLQGTPGATAVLHTHSRQLEFHPHIHIVMPAAAINKQKRLWRTKKSKQKDRGGYLFNHKALAKVFRAKLLAAINQEGLALPERHPEKWVVDCRSVGSGEKALVYLGRYLYRGVIQEKDIISCQNGIVTFRYQNSKTGKRENRSVSGVKFLWLLMQHILPKSFRRARNYGFLHPNSKRLMGLLHYLLKVDIWQAIGRHRKRPSIICRCCGAPMKIVATRIIEPIECQLKAGVEPLM
jgi:hypothetical protein